MSLLPIERAALNAHAAGKRCPQTDGSSDGWVRFCLQALLSAGQTVRGQRLISWEGTELDLKRDGSPATVVDRQVEEDLGQLLADFAPDATLVGEETGGTLPTSGMALAVDPIDGTWSFVTSSATHASSLAVFRDGRPWLGFVGNPATGEVAYTHPEAGARLLQLDLFGEGTTVYTLPIRRGLSGKVLVSLHPSRAAASSSEALYRAWAEGELRMVRAPGGSPADALMESAKGRYTYANLWGKSPAAPFDLAAGALVLRACGGEVEDLDGRPIEVVGHEGTFVAGLEAEGRKVVREILANAAHQ